MRGDCRSHRDNWNQQSRAHLVHLWRPYCLLHCTQRDGRNCKALTAVIGTGILSIFALANKRSGGISARGDFGNATEAIHGILAKEFDSYKIPYQAITDATEDILELYGDGDEKPLSVSSIHGLTHKSNPPVNLDLYHFGNGTGHVHLPWDMFENRTSTSMKDRISKRNTGQGPGFKTSYTTRTASQLTQEHRSDMADAISYNWGTNADATDLRDYIGFVKTDKIAKFYYRIIPEQENFALNYESVDICGGIKDEL